MLENIPYFSYVISVFMGIGLAAASGFRVFLPLFAVSLSSYFNWVPLTDNFQWLSGVPVLISLGIATIAEIFAYYIPVVDNFLDSISVPLASIAGTLLFASQFVDLGTFPQWALALIAGGGTAAAISSGFAGTRAVSTASTGGLGNFALATTETAGAGIMSILAMVLPVVSVIIAIILLIIILFYGKKLWKSLKE